MSKKSEFIKFVNDLIAAAPSVAATMSADAGAYLAALQIEGETSNSELTDNGKLILKHLQDNPNTKMWKARDIAEGLFKPSRSIAGACRKLVSDAYLEKLGDSPAVYMITEKGKNTII